MRERLAGWLHAALRRMPAARNVYAQRDALAAALAAVQGAGLGEAPEPAADGAAARHARLVATSGFGAVSGFLLQLAEDGPLGARGDRLLLPLDEAMLPSVLHARAWQAEELRFITAHADPQARYALLDIGANVGLFARQACRAVPAIETVLCVEADPQNFQALAHNLAHLPRSALALHHVALAAQRGQMIWYRDLENFGNYSLNPDAMRDRPCATHTVEAVETGAFFAEHPPPEGCRIIWKSDTQGYDEAIVTRVPDALWERVDLAIIELWRIAKPEFDRDVLRRRLAAFPHRSIGLAGTASVDEVIAYLDGRDYGFSDLYLWR